MIAPQVTLTRIIGSANGCQAYAKISEAFRQGRKLAELPNDHPACRLKHIWHQLSRTEDCILMVDGDKIYMPADARKDTLQQLHNGHCGYVKTLETACSLYYWPTVKHDIRVMIDNCEACQKLLPSKPLEPLITTTATFPMEMISINLFHVGNKMYMVTADRFSGYIWVDLLRTRARRPSRRDKITRVFGIPLTCRMDGGPQFRGPFHTYCQAQGIRHETSSPYNPRSNGHAEAAVKSAKHLLLKTGPAEFPAALAAWRNTSRNDKPSPNELLFGRKIRDTKAIALSQINHHTETVTRSPEIPRQQNSEDPEIPHVSKIPKTRNRPSSRETQCAYRTRLPNNGISR